MTLTNPFTERGRITEPARFAGRWGELSLIFERLSAGRPVLVSGPPGIGKSSLLTHVVQSAAVNLELPDLHAFYVDMRGAADAAEIYRSLAATLRQRGDTLAALELAVVASEDGVLLCLDNAQDSLAAGWGEGLLEALARVARGSDLFLVAAVEGSSPPLSEPFAQVRLGALAPPEVRLLTETYLDDAGISFTPAELREIADLSAAHPAYVQRAAFHLFQSKIDPSYDWRASYAAEVRARPVPGAPLPPAVFEGRGGDRVAQSGYGETAAGRAASQPDALPLPEAPRALALLFPLLIAFALFLMTGSLPLALAVAVVGIVAVGRWLRN